MGRPRIVAEGSSSAGDKAEREKVFTQHITAEGSSIADNKAERESFFVNFNEDYEYAFNKARGKINIWILWIAFGISFLLVASWVSHLILPKYYYWIEDDALAQIKAIITGAIFGSVSSLFISKNFLGKTDSS